MYYITPFYIVLLSSSFTSPKQTLEQSERRYIRLGTKSGPARIRLYLSHSPPLPIIRQSTFFLIAFRTFPVTYSLHVEDKPQQILLYLRRESRRCFHRIRRRT